jgi:DNA primase
LEEGLNVKVALIPDGHDPDSYIRLTGAAGFAEFIKREKKDVILFQVQVALQDAGDDSQKKSALVNQVAETISRINKTEDFTRQDDYIRRSAELLKIDEAGLHALVNKFIREKIGKQEQQTKNEERVYHDAETGVAEPPPDDDTINLLFRDEQHERNIVRVLIESGIRQWEEDTLVADYILGEATDTELFDNKQLVQMMDLYKEWFAEGREPVARDFLYSDDKVVAATVVSLVEFPYEISPKWGSKFDMPVPDREAVYREDVMSSVFYLQMRKIKRLIEENQKDLEQPHTEEETEMLMQTHQLLKQQEIELSKRTGMTIYK